MNRLRRWIETARGLVLLGVEMIRAEREHRRAVAEAWPPLNWCAETARRVEREFRGAITITGRGQDLLLDVPDRRLWHGAPLEHIVPTGPRQSPHVGQTLGERVSHLRVAQCYYCRAGTCVQRVLPPDQFHLHATAIHGPVQS